MGFLNRHPASPQPHPLTLGESKEDLLWCPKVSCSSSIPVRFQLRPCQVHSPVTGQGWSCGVAPVFSVESDPLLKPGPFPSYTFLDTGTACIL